MRKFYFSLLIFLSLFVKIEVASAADKLFTCRYDAIINSSIDKNEGDKYYFPPLTFPLTIEVYNDGNSKFINAGHEMKNGYNNRIYLDENSTHGQVGININTKDYYTKATASGKYQCPDLTLSASPDSSVYTVANENLGNSDGFNDHRRVTNGGTPILENNSEIDEDKVLKETDSCPTFRYRSGDINAVNINFDLTLKMYSDGSKKVCITMSESDDACTTVNNDGGAINYNYGITTYNFIIDPDEVPNLFKQNFHQIEYNNFSCPSDIYIYQSHGIDAGIYQITTNKELAEEYKYSTDLDNNNVNNADIPNDINNGDSLYRCDEIVPLEIRNWIQDALNLVKYIALVLVIVLGIVDFIKAAASGEAEQVKKSGQSFLKRIIAVVILFLLPVLVELILNLIEIYGADSTCFPN